MDLRVQGEAKMHRETSGPTYKSPISLVHNLLPTSSLLSRALREGDD